MDTEKELSPQQSARPKRACRRDENYCETIKIDIEEEEHEIPVIKGGEGSRISSRHTQSLLTRVGVRGFHKNGNLFFRVGFPIFAEGRGSHKMYNLTWERLKDNQIKVLFSFEATDEPTWSERRDSFFAVSIAISTKNSSTGIVVDPHPADILNPLLKTIYGSVPEAGFIEYAFGYEGSSRDIVDDRGWCAQ